MVDDPRLSAQLGGQLNAPELCSINTGLFRGIRHHGTGTPTVKLDRDSCHSDPSASLFSAPELDAASNRRLSRGSAHWSLLRGASDQTSVRAHAAVLTSFQAAVSWDLNFNFLGFDGTGLRIVSMPSRAQIDSRDRSR